MTPSTPEGNSSITPSKKPGRPSNRRPKMIPVKMRNRLTNLGLKTRSNDTTNDNLRDLIEKISTDIQNYSIAAQHWQRKTIELQSMQNNTSEDGTQGYEDQEELYEVGNFESAPPGPISQFEFEMLLRLKRAANPTLNIHSMMAPKVRSMVKSISKYASDESFLNVLHHIGSIGNLFGVFKETPGTWSSISKMKPNFDEVRAKQIWANAVTPVETDAFSLNWDASPGARAPYQFIDPHDPDYDHLDRLLARASDYQVLDFLHYSSLLLLGLNHAVLDNPDIKELRDHMGVQVERLLREAVVVRNISTQSQFAAEFICSIVDTFYYYSFQGHQGALGAILEIAWSVASRHSDIIHPIMKAMIIFESTVWAPNDARRAIWMARNEELIKTAERPYFHLVSTSWFTACFYALSVRDEDTLLYYLDKLDKILVPGNRGYDSDEFSVSSPFETSISLPPSPKFYYGPVSPSANQWNQDPNHSNELWNQFASHEVESQSACSELNESLDLSTDLRDEQTKTCLRAALHFVRAEAALISSNSEMCMQWIDQAELEMRSLPDPFLFQKLLLTDIPSFRQAFNTRHVFPSGSTSIAEELDFRVRLRCSEFIAERARQGTE